MMFTYPPIKVTLKIPFTITLVNFPIIIDLERIKQESGFTS